jgi:hypothetical protein
MPNTFQDLGTTLGAFLPTILIALLVLVVGWLIAYGISRLVESLLHRTTLDDRIAGMMRGGDPDRIPAERWIALVVFWLIMLFVIMVFLQVLNLGMVFDPLSVMLTNVVAFLPNLLAAAALIVVAWLVATVLRLVITRVLSASAFSRRVSEDANVDPRNRNTIGQTVGNVVYWLVFLLFLPAILDALQLQGILAPVQGMVNNILAAIPNIFAAIVLLAIAYFIARVIGSLVTSILAGIGFNRLFAADGPIPVTSVAAAATRPAPTTRIETETRRRSQETPAAAVEVTRKSPAEIVGWIVMVSIILFAAMEAANLLGFETLTVLISTFIVAGWNILFGLVIFGLGLWLGNVAYRMIRGTHTTNSHILGNAARLAIIIFSGALALRQMGIAQTIVDLAFGLMLGAVAIAVALAFGLGGRDVAHQLLERWRGRLREEAAKPEPPIPQTGSMATPPAGEVNTYTPPPTTDDDFTTRPTDRNLTDDFPPPPDRDIPTPPAGEPDL